MGAMVEYYQVGLLDDVKDIEGDLEKARLNISK